MPSDPNIRVLDLVERALEVEPERLSDWLDDVCDGDLQLRAEVASLLGFQGDAGELLKVDNNPSITRIRQDFKGDTESAGTLMAGDQIGDYQIEEQIGAGGMGVVYQAKQLSLGRTVAIKVLSGYLRDSSTARARFQREVEAAARLRHEHIVSVHTMGDDGTTSYYAMELIDGPTLGEVLAALRRDPIPELQSSTPSPKVPTSETSSLDQSRQMSQLSGGEILGLSFDESATPRAGSGYFDLIAGLLAGVADGLDFAHQHQIVHRDVKPSNLLLSSDGKLHISDFGLARVLAEPGVTQTGEFVGTPYYMAPEQFNRSLGEVDGRTDVYALGATLYEMLTLRPPFPGSSRDEVLANIAAQEPTPPRRINRRVPRDLETICLKAIEKQPERRYQSAALLAEDLRCFQQRLPIAAQRSGLLERTKKWCLRHPSMAASLALAAGLAITAAVLAIQAHKAQQQQEIVAAQASRMKDDLQLAQAAIDRAKLVEQQRVFETAFIAALQGDDQAAAAAVDEAERLGASPGRLQVLRGQIAMIAADFTVALTHLKSAVAQLPENIAANALLAETYARLEHWDKSTHWRERVEAMQPASVEDWMLAGRMHSYHDPVVAEKMLDEAIRLDKESVVARLVRGAIRVERAYHAGDPVHAELALEDLHLAQNLLSETPYLLSRLLHAHLTAAAGYEIFQNRTPRDEHVSAAGAIAEKLGDYDREYEAHRWRAYYFEHVGDLERAADEWRAIDDKTIGYLAMTLFRLGRFEEALATCDEYGASVRTGTAEFCHSFVLSATCSSSEELVGDFRLDQDYRHRSDDALLRGTHILWNLAGKPERAIKEMQRIDIDPGKLREGTARYEFQCGAINDSKYLEQTASSRYEQARAHFVIGIHELGRGRRGTAYRHFEDAIAYRFDYNFFTAMSRALVAQLKRNPQWPHWIAEAAE